MGNGLPLPEQGPHNGVSARACGSCRLRKGCIVPEAVAKHVHDLQQRLHAQIPGEVIKLQQNKEGFQTRAAKLQKTTVGHSPRQPPSSQMNRTGSGLSLSWVAPSQGSGKPRGHGSGAEAAFLSGPSEMQRGLELRLQPPPLLTGCTDTTAARHQPTSPPPARWGWQRTPTARPATGTAAAPPPPAQPSRWGHPTEQELACGPALSPRCSEGGNRGCQGQRFSTSLTTMGSEGEHGPTPALPPR